MKMYLDCRKLPFENDSIDLIITDPPWPFYLRLSSNSKAVKTTDFTLLSWEDLEICFCEMYRVLKKSCHCYVFAPNILLQHVFDLIKKSNFKYWQLLIWIKNTFGLGHTYRNKSECILFLSKERRKPIKSKNVSNVFYVKNEGKAVKPSELYKIFIEQSAVDGDIVLDPFAGSAPLEKLKDEFPNIKLISGDIAYK